MGKKANLIETFGMRWEFLRRNKEYIKDYSSYINSNEDGYDKYVVFFQNKYGIIHPLNPRVSFLEALKEGKKTKTKRKFSVSNIFSKHRAELISGYLSFLNKGAICSDSDRHIFGFDPDGKMEYDLLSEDELKQKNIIRIAIDLDIPSSRILEDVQRIVEQWKRMRSKVTADNLGRLRLEEYKRYLEVYDLWSKGWGIFKLAKKFYGGDMERDAHYAKTKVKRDYERCKELIDGDYRQIR